MAHVHGGLRNAVSSGAGCLTHIDFRALYKALPPHEQVWQGSQQYVLLFL
jgi:hypothetical protein